MNKEELEILVNQKLSIRELSIKLELSVAKVRYLLKKFNLRTNGYDKSHNWEENNLRNAVNQSKCKSDVLRYLGIPIKSGNFQTLDRYLKSYNIDSSGLTYDFKRGNKWVKKYSDEQIFCEHSTYGKPHLKKKIINENKLPYSCQECGLGPEWNNKQLVLQLDHINGINDDNRLENLRFLCPNCHSQTETYCLGKK